MWSQLQMFTVPPANDSLAAVPPTDAAGLDQQRAQAGLGQVRGAHQAVVPGADHDRVEVRVSGATSSILRRSARSG